MSLVNKFLEDFLPYDRNYTISTSRKDDRPHSADYFYIKVLEKVYGMDGKGEEHEVGYVGRDSTPDNIKVVGGTYNFIAKEFKDRDEALEFIDAAEPLSPGQRLVAYRPTVFPRSWY